MTEAAERFAADLTALAPPAARLGIAVSGGPDSLALLLLAAAARPGGIEAATVDHRLRPGSAADAAHVAAICATLNIPHAILIARWIDPPTTNLQARAREERYALLSDWAHDRRLTAIATAHHADDQAETLLMRLARGAGIAGLGGARPSRPLADTVTVIRPLLTWRRAELAAIVAQAGLAPLDDPANRDPRHDRARLRAMLADADWADPARLAASASHLRDADEALEWMTATLAEIRLTRTADAIILDPAGLPRELQRRLLLLAFDTSPRGPDLARAIDALIDGRTVTLSGLKLSGGETWRITKAQSRR